MVGDIVVVVADTAGVDDTAAAAAAAVSVVTEGGRPVAGVRREPGASWESRYQSHNHHRHTC